MNTALKLNHSILVLALAAIYPLHATAAASAGVAQFIAGDVNVRRTDGKTDPLVKGKDIESGQAILTGATGRAQVRFSDGGLISLQPNTEFKIANYVDQADPKQDRFLVDLLRGSMRAITGLIGKRNHDNYKVTTTTATIGIRGSGFSAGYNPDGSLGVTTELDAIEVCNAGGCVALTAGESVRVANATDAPVRTNVKAPVPPPDPVREVINVGDTVNSDGKSKFVADATKDKDKDKDKDSSSSSNNGTYTNLKMAATYFRPGQAPPNPYVTPVVASSATIDGGKLTTFTATDVYAASTSTNFSSAGSIAAGDFIGWGTWTTGSKNTVNAVNNLHYVVGQPTVTMPATAGILTYTLAGATPVTSYVTSGGAAGISGTLTSASLSVNFTSSKMDVAINTTLGNISTTGGAIMISGSQFSYSSSTGIYVDGFFAGVNASRAGLVYTGPILSTGSFSGAASFKAP